MSKDELSEMVDERVLVHMMNGNEFAGELKSIDENYALTLSENGGPEPDDDDFVMGDTNYKNVSGDRVFNWENVESVERLKDYRDWG